MMTRHVLAIPILLAATAIPASSEDKKHDAPKHAAFEQIKSLVGEWEGTETGKKDFKVHAVYKLTSGGSAVVETLFPGTDHEMVSMIHADGPALLLTHYCMLGNQPHMKAVPKAGDNKIAFEFVKVTNLKSDKDCAGSA